MRSVSLLGSLALLALATAVSLPGPISPAAAASRSSGGVVFFSRPASFGAAFKRPDVIVDGRKVGSIGAGECHGVKLPAGYHKIAVRDQKSVLSWVGLDINAARVTVAEGSETFITVRPMQEQKDFNDSAPAYELQVSESGNPCW